MGKIYENQTDLTLIVETNKNLSGITNVQIITQNPNMVMGTFIAEVFDAVNGKIRYIISAPLVVVGKWTCWAKVIDAGGLISIGEPFTMTVYKSGN